jgi:DNA helicase-2/ATP-dependent DNA helicase PcrA
VVKLEQNYRSRQSILDAAMAVVSHNSERKPKRLWTTNPPGEPVEVHSAESSYAESLFVCRRIERYLQQGETGVAVLYRINFLSRQFEDTLNRFGLPFRLVGGVSFYKRKEVRDALAYLRVARNPRDNLALERIINTPPRGIGPKSLARLRLGAARNGDSLWDAVRRDADQDDTPRRLRNVLERFVALVGQWRQCLDLEQPLHIVLEQILHSSAYVRTLEREESEEANNRLLNLQELLSVARDHSDSGRSVQEFLDETALRSEADDYDEAAPVTLMTLHNAKGLEFPIVFLVGMEEKLLPHTRSRAEGNLEEERRLCYVGMTRARKRLILTLARTRRMWGGDVEERRQASSFLAEIPRRLVR